MAERYARERIGTLTWEVEALRDSAFALEREHADALAAVPADQRPSARNLLHYLAVRQHDIRGFQDQLAELGLSSLGRLESHALASIDAVLGALRHLGGRAADASEPPASVDFGAGARVLGARTQALLGPAPKERRVPVAGTPPLARGELAGSVAS